MQKPQNLKIAENIVPANRFEGSAAWKKTLRRWKVHQKNKT